MELVIRWTGVCLVAVALGLTLRRSQPSLALLLSVAAVGGVLWALAEPLGTLLAFLRELTARSGVPQALFAPLYKTLGIALVVRLGCGLCRDAGESALAAALETAGAVCALLTALPLFEAVLELMTELI